MPCGDPYGDGVVDDEGELLHYKDVEDLFYSFDQATGIATA